MRRTALLLVFILLLTGCAAFGGGEDGPPAEAPAPTAETTAPETDNQTAPPTDEPFKTQLVLCAAGAPPERVYDTGDPVADALRAMVTLPAAQFGEDYIAEPGGLLSVLPSFEDGTVRLNDDGTVTVDLSYRSDLSWSDGEPFKLEDVLLGLQVPASRFQPTFDVIEARIDGDVVVVTADAGAEYPYVPSQPPLPSHLMDEPGPLPLDVTLGPYVLREAGRDLVFDAHPAVADSVIPEVAVLFLDSSNQSFAALQDGTCDVVLDGNLGQFQVSLLDIGDANIDVWTGSAYERLIFNTFPPAGRTPYFADVRVRQAVAHALNRRAMNSFLTGGLGPIPQSWIPSEHWAFGAVLDYDNDTALAEALLEEAGWVDANGDSVREYVGSGGVYACQRGEWTIEEGTPLAPVLVIPADDRLRDFISQGVAVDLNAVGFNVQVEFVDGDTMFSGGGPIAQRNFDMTSFATIVRPDPGGIERWVGEDVYRHPQDLNVVHRWELEDRWLRNDQLVERLALDNTPTLANDFTGQNFSGWCNEEANIAIVEANVAQGIEARTPFYQQQQTIYGQEVPTLPLFARPRIAARALYVCGPATGPVEPLTWNISEWYFEESGVCSR